MSNISKFISLGKVNKYILLIVSGVLFKLCLSLFKEKFYTENEIIHLSGIPLIFFYSFGLSLSFSLYIIYKRCNKRNLKQNKNLVLFSKQIKKVSKLKKFLWILFISFIDFISIVLRTLIKETSLYDISSWIINFLFMCLYFYFIFNIKLYKHHIIGIIWFLITGIILNLIGYGSIQNNDFSLKDFLLEYALNFLSVTLYCLTFVIYKLIIHETYLKSFEIIFFQGLIELLLSFILLVILINYGVIYNLQYYMKEIQKIGVIYLILIVFLNFGYYSHIYIIIDILSPFHIFLIIMINYIIIGFVGLTSSLYNKFGFLKLICLFITFIRTFLVLVFIEIIELKCFGLSYMTKKNIELRAQLETYIDDDEDDNDENNKIPYEGYIIELNDDKTVVLNDNDIDSSNED